MKIRRKIIHYKLSSILMIMGFTISFICFFNCVNLYHLLSVKKQEENDYTYKSQSGLYGMKQEENIQIEDFLFSEQGNIVIKDYLLFRDMDSAMGLADIIMEQNEEFPYPVCEGELPKSEEEFDEPVIILGRGLKAETEYRDGNYYYYIEGQEYRVCAFLGSDKSDILDGVLMVYYDWLPEKTKAAINVENEYWMEIGSNKVNVNSLCGRLKENAKAISDEITIAIINDKPEVMGMAGVDERNQYLIIFIFCLFNVLIVSEYWIKSRLREIAIRKMFGYSEEKIYWTLYGDMIKNTAFSVGLSIIVQFVLKMCFEDYLLLYKSQFLYYMGYSVLFVVVLSAVMLLYPMYLIRKENILKKMISDCL